MIIFWLAACGIYWARTRLFGQLACLYMLFMLFSVVEHVTGAIVHLRFLVISVPGVHPPPSMFLRYDVHHGPLMVVTTSLLFRVP